MGGVWSSMWWQGVWSPGSVIWSMEAVNVKLLLLNATPFVDGGVHGWEGTDVLITLRADVLISCCFEGCKLAEKVCLTTLLL